VTSLFPHTLLQLSINPSLLLTLQYTFLLSFSNPPLATLTLTLPVLLLSLPSSPSACFPYSSCPFLLFYKQFMIFPFQIQPSILRPHFALSTPCHLTRCYNIIQKFPLFGSLTSHEQISPSEHCLCLPITSSHHENASLIVSWASTPM